MTAIEGLLTVAYLIALAAAVPGWLLNVTDVRRYQWRLVSLAVVALGTSAAAGHEFDRHRPWWGVGLFVVASLYWSHAFAANRHLERARKAAAS